MNTVKYNLEEKLKIIDEAKKSGNVLATAKRYSISDGAIRNWIKRLDKKPEKNQSADLTNEVRRLKKILADKELENAILKDLVKKTVQVWTHEEQQLLNTSPSDFLKRKS
jgi:transposase-like protein